MAGYSLGWIAASLFSSATTLDLDISNLGCGEWRAGGTGAVYSPSFRYVSLPSLRKATLASSSGGRGVARYFCDACVSSWHFGSFLESRFSVVNGDSGHGEIMSARVNGAIAQAMNSKPEACAMTFLIRTIRFLRRRGASNERSKPP